MNEFAIITDTCSDLSKETRQKYNIDYIPMHVSYGENNFPASLDWDYYTPNGFYNVMREGTRVITAQINQSEYIEKFSEYLEKGINILSISCSSALSGSYKTSIVAKDELMKKYPQAKIYCIDALNSSLGEGAMVIEAAKMRIEGKSLDEIANWLEENKLCFNQFGTVDDLNYLKKAGRITAMSAVFGGLFQIKPIIISDAIGQNFAITKVKGAKNALKTIVNMIKEDIIEPEKQTIYISHADCRDAAEQFKEMIKAEINPKDFYIDYIGPIVGASVGPGTIIVYYFGHKVTVNAPEQKA